jgi:hypothetical protein
LQCIGSFNHPIAAAQTKTPRNHEMKKTVWQMVGCIFALCYPDEVPVAAYLARHGGDLDFDDKDLHTQLHHWCANKKANLTLHDTINPTSTAGQRRHKSASNFWKEWRLHSWVETTNLQKGIAPCSSLLCQAGGPPGIEPTAIPFPIGCAHKHRSKLQWCRRWRRRWNVQLGKFAPGEHVEPHLARAKVHGNSMRKIPRHGVHILHSEQKCAPQKRGQKMDLILAPL